MTQHPDLERLAHAIGVGIGDLAFGITFGNGDVWALQALSLEAAMNGDITQFIASHKGVNIVWTFTPWQDGFWVTLALEGTHGLNCRSLTSLSLTFTSDPADDIGEWWVPNAGKSVHGVGMFKVNELTEHTRTDTRLRGAFKDSHTPGLFLGTRIPQTHEHDYAITCQDNTLQIHCTTWLSVGMAANTTVVSEATWVCANKCALVAQKTYATHLPYKPVDVADIPTGWNSRGSWRGRCSRPTSEPSMPIPWMRWPRRWSARRIH